MPTSAAATETDPCAFVTNAPQWYNSLPASIKSAITSYESAVISWEKEHSAALASLNSGQPTYTGAAPGLVCTNTGAAVVAGKTTTASGAQNTGSTATGTAAGASSSKAAAPRVTGVVGISFAGAVGVMGLMVAL